MSLVYQAWDLRLERPVAIKVLREDFSSSEGFRERFRQEAKAAANLSHPNIVTVHDFGLDHERLYIVMEYVPGTDLKTMMKAHGAFSIDEAIPLMVQACAGIGYAHRAGFVHCDVKPHNMLVTPDQRLKVTDFGIARAMASIQPDEKNDIVWGSPQYFSPEQASGQAPMPASDVYSLGVILYEMLTGRLPFNSDDPGELARMHRDVAPIPPRVFVPSIPPALRTNHAQDVIQRAGQPLPYRRPDGTDTTQFQPIGRSVRGQHSTLAQPGSGRALSRACTPPPQAKTPFRPVIHRQTAGSSHPPRSFLPPAPAEPTEAEPALEIDWGIVGMALLALIAAGGLIPFWLYVWLTFNPPR